MTFEGTGVAIITPFNDDLSIDFGALKSTIEHVIAGGVDYIVALGTTGETATLNHEEKEKVIEFCKKEINNRVPLVVGVGGNNTQEVVKALKALDKSGVSGILSVAPYYNKPTQSGLYEHFKLIANATGLPVIIYNVPGRTSANISAETTVKLAKTCKNIVAIKEASGDFLQIMQIIKNKPSGFEVLSGDDALTLPMISLGARGVISVVANSHPNEFSKLVNYALDGNFTEANKYQYKIIDLIEALFTEGNPAGVKAVLEINALAKKFVRLPLMPVSNEHFEKIRELIVELNK
jgi:4-hydroxy-tetrahydrodipicolinate synthase